MLGMSLCSLKINLVSLWMRFGLLCLLGIVRDRFGFFRHRFGFVRDGIGFIMVR